MSKNDKAQDELDFGVCNVDKARTITIYLSNVTEVTANWQLNYIKFPKKQTVSKYTTTQWEEENLTKLDDPEVFEFEEASVSISANCSSASSSPANCSPQSFNFVFQCDRVCSRASQSHSGRFQRDSSSHQFPRMNTRSSSFQRQSRLNSE